jgi:cyanophycin synthetase
MLNNNELSKLHSNQRLLVSELQSRGVDVNTLFPDLELLTAEYQGHKELLLDRDSSITPYSTTIISGDKYLSKKIMQLNGIAVPIGEMFFPEQIDDALRYAQNLGYPLVVKPTFGSHGDDVFMDLDHLVSVKNAIDCIVAKKRNFLVEEQFEGKEYRIFITKNGEYAVLHRDCAYVVGDGHLNIAELVVEETNRRLNPRTNALCPIVIDITVEQYLAKQKRTLDDIPVLGEKIYLRHNSNVAKGGMCEDYTAKIHPSAIEIAKKVLASFPGMPYAGIDVLSTDIAQVQTCDRYRVLEVNSIPGIHMHMNPGRGISRNVAKMIADIIFPETKK